MTGSTIEKCVRTSLIINQAIAKRNIQRMAEKAVQSSVRLRPHCKTHQSPIIVGNWLREVGITSVAVSSLKMAQEFAAAGWQDILIAIPANLREAEELNALSKMCRLGVFIESLQVAARLAEAEAYQLDIWLKIDSGYGRTGVRYDDSDTIVRLAKSCRQFGLKLRGIATHAGHSYNAISKEQIARIFHETVEYMISSQQRLREEGIEVEISTGDTPGCSTVNDFGLVDEVRAGNFVYYDLMQKKIGSCSREDIAVAVACPVLALQNRRNEVVLHGGAVHLSKDVLQDEQSRSVYGVAYPLSENGWNLDAKGAVLRKLSQEHGIMEMPEGWTVQPGDLVAVLPVHSCLAANLLKGEEIVL
ncbi:MAG: alanine racemase [Calditrichia bacterium]